MKPSLGAILGAALIGFAGSVAAQEGGSLPLPPKAEAGSYDPQLTAKEASLANWALAVSGIRAGKVVSDKVVEAEGSGMPFDALAEQARFALKTMIVRYNSANWLLATDDDVAPIDGGILLAAVRAAGAECAGQGCEAERAALAKAFADASAAFGRAAETAAAVATSRESKGERELITEVLDAMADYLASPAWHSDLALTETGRDGEEISARIVGTLALWRNVEPYVGLTSAEVDDAVNAAIETLLRDLRRTTRNAPVLAPDSAEIARLIVSASALAVELRRSAALFRS